MDLRMPSVANSPFKIVFLAVAVTLSNIRAAKGLQWLALTQISALATEPQLYGSVDCEPLHLSLVKQEMKFCKDHPAFMKAVRDGAKWAIDECQFQFRTRRWNCSTLNDDGIMLSRRRRQKIQIVSIPNERMQKTEGSPSGNGTLTGGRADERLVETRSRKVSKRLIDEEPFKAKDFSPTGKNPMVTYFKQDKTTLKKKLTTETEGDDRFIGGSHGRRRYLAHRGPVFPQGTREAAFVHAISSAGVAHAITRRCSSGLIEDCGCDGSIRGSTKNGFQWEGCSDNIAYGISLSKRFVDAKDMHLVRRGKRMKRNPKRRRRVARALMNLHNNEAGRKLIENNMRVQCKCHGVSGSCEVKTCWRSMPTFREIGEHLKEKFDGATEVKLEIVGGRADLRPNQQFFKRPSETDLVYLSKSPEYCERDLKQGSLGTTGRRCNKASHSLDGCDLLCCGRGYTTHLEKVKERCQCKFHWCCYVKCSICTRNEEVYTCK